MTEREKDVLLFIAEYKLKNDISPTLKEIMKGVNSKSCNHIHQCIQGLIDKGYLEVKDKSPRSIVIKKFI